ncbi:unnamed protein product [Blepharisma stoltei]|uniref:Uncharacterized protein n=1 Tax=Blepharisma stoltei TaxID=1481888 RepID=A0AAU9IIN1_9CILI|nr:unnamed protein product [Blepharisma stoltei]
MEGVKLVWHDPNIFGPENSCYIVNNLSPAQYKLLEMFPKLSDSYQHLLKNESLLPLGLMDKNLFNRLIIFHQ